MRPVILMYHSVTDGDLNDPYGVSIELFYDQISWLIEKGYHFISLSDLVQHGKNSIFDDERKEVVLTFDDGYHNFFTNALPILLHYRLSATVLLVTEKLGQTSTWNRYAQEDPIMTESEVRQVKSQGISLGSHTLTHVDLTTLGNNELKRQLIVSKMSLVDFGETFFSFSYPWGRYSDREVAALKAAGYHCAVTVGRPINFYRDDWYRLGRLTMYRGLDLETFGTMIVSNTQGQWISAWFRSLVRRVQERISLAG
jgi:peptidoglycan/xylan/chitin deacetylase (PgdA/CDA1 family)